MRLAQLRREIVAATSARGVGSPRPHLHPDCAHPAPRPQLQQDRAHPCHISAGTGLTPATSAPGLLPARSAVNQRSPAHPHKCDIPDGAIMDGMISRTAWYAPPLFQRPRAVLRRPPRTVALGAASERSHATPWHAAWLRTYRYSWGTRGTRGPPPLTARSLAMLPRERCAAAKTSVHLARGRSGRGAAARNTPRCDGLPSCQRRVKTNPSAATPRRQEGFRFCLPVQRALKRALSQSTGCAERAARSACARSKAATTLRH